MKRLLLIPVALLGLFLVGRLALPHAWIHLFFRVDIMLLAGLAAAASVAAGLGFDRGDHLRTAWLLNAWSYCFVFLGATVRIFPNSRAVLFTRIALAVFGNTFGIASVWLFARTYRVAGLELPGSTLRKGLFVAGAVVLATLAAGHSLYLGVVQGMAGDLEQWVGAVSSAGDIATFVLVAPVLLTALALRGGLLVWPWGLYVASNVAWLLFDAQDTLSSLVHEAAGQVLEDYGETWRTLGCAVMVCAALAQRRLNKGDDDTA